MRKLIILPAITPDVLSSHQVDVAEVLDLGQAFQELMLVGVVSDPLVFHTRRGQLPSFPRELSVNMRPGYSRIWPSQYTTEMLS
ncbi:MAG: hypothetical protein AAF483_07460 [Planctomycetota bacterium]